LAGATKNQYFLTRHSAPLFVIRLMQAKLSFKKNRSLAFSSALLLG